jgi:hypothetical protein
MHVHLLLYDPDSLSVKTALFVILQNFEWKFTQRYKKSIKWNNFDPVFMQRF